jgi:hypothetical protein
MADIDENNSNTGKDTSASYCTCRITKIISGGQTGADQAALDVAIDKGYSPWWLGTKREIDRGRHASRKIPAQRNGNGQLSAPY